MKDQVDSLVRRGIKAARFDSHQSSEEYLEVMRQLRSGELKLLYVAPER
jgi:ATP-dependent DNA helicase RecQ